MPLDGSGNYYYPLGTPGVPNQTIESEKYNAFLDDLRDHDLNVARPVSRGGTGASTPEQARTNLGVMASSGGPMTGSIIVTGSITASTGPSAGTIYLGTDGTHYLHWDGTTYSMPNGPLWIGGTVTAPVITVSGAGSFGLITTTGAGSFGSITAGSISGSSVSSSGTVSGSSVSSSGTVSGASISSTGNASVGLNLVVSGTINSGAITTTSLTAAGNVTGGVITGSTITSSGDVYANSGTIRLKSDASKYLHWDGTNYQLGGSGIPLTSGNWGSYVPTNYMLNTGGTYTGNLYMNGNLGTSTSPTVGVVLFGGGGHNLNYNSNHGDGWTFFGGAGGFWIGTGGYKPGGGDWADSSDARIKNVLGEYASGLAQIKQLRPQRYKFKGNDEDHLSVTEKEFIGLIAQDVETVMPEMVTQKSGKIDGVEVQDLRMLDASALIYALVNAVRELSDRVEELESAG